MPTVVATPGAADANSFATVADADAYLDARLNASAWTDDADDDAKARALIEATRELNQLQYTGTRATATQALAWPRRYAVNPDAPVDISPLGESGLPEFDDDVIPTRVRDATIELALEFLKAGTRDVASYDEEPVVTRTKVDVLEKEFAHPLVRTTGLARFPRVMQLVGPLLVAGGLSVART